MNFWGDSATTFALSFDDAGLLFWAGVVALVIAVAMWLWPRS